MEIGSTLDGRLAALYKKIEKLEKEERFCDLAAVYEECIRISLEVYGEYHDETLALYSEYGGLLRNLGRYDEALPILKRALHCARHMKGREHPDYAAALVNLANLFRMMQYYEESEALFLRAKEIYEKRGENHLFPYAGLCNNLGLLYQQLHRYAEAISLHKKSLSVLEKDKTHEVLYGVTLNNLVEPYKASGQKEKAVSCLKKAIAIFKKYSGATVLYAAALNNLGAIYYEAQNYERAVKCFGEALSISRDRLGETSDSCQRSLHNYEQAKHMLKTQKKVLPRQQTDSIGHIAQRPLSCSCSMENDSLPDYSEHIASLPAIDENSRGLDMAESYFFHVCYPVLKENFARWLPRMAAGLIGEGSECYGFDDKLSRDHDFGPSFQIFIPKEDMDIYGNDLQKTLSALPKSYCGFEARTESAYGSGRVGVFAIEDFYDKYLSIHEVPSTNRLWLQIEDIPLSTATNGRVFFDHLGHFTAIRNGLLRHYPTDVRLKRMAAECMQIAQSGQYNLPRSLKRRQYVAASHALDAFVTHFSSFIYLINKTYRPYYKWEQEGLRRLPVLGQYAFRELGKLVLIPLHEKPDYILFTVESLCGAVVSYLQKHQLTSSDSDFLLDHGPELLAQITDEKLRLSNPWTVRI